MKYKFLYIILLVCSSLQMMAENASNIRVRQRNKDIIITYDLSKTSNVLLYVSTAAHSTFVTLEAVEGAVGKNVHAGQNLEIIWHPLEEGENFIADGVRFKVEALGSYEEYIMRGNSMETFVTVDFGYGFAPQLSGGLMVGQTYSGYGWYVNARTNFHFLSATDGLTCSEGGYIDGVLPFYIGRKQSSLFVVNAGFVIDFIEIAGASPRNRFNTFGMYVGLGYGWRKMLWETTDGKWIQYTPSSFNGLSGNAGILFSVYGLTIKAGVNTIAFKYLDIEAGIGWMF